MKSKIKVMISLVLTLALILMSSTVAFAGTSAPSSTWNLTTSGTYTFSGSAQNSTLYTNYKFKETDGCNYLEVKVVNNSSSSLTVNLIKDGLIFNTTVKTKTISANSTGYLRYYVDEGLSTDTYYYISFSAPSDFSGSISEWY